MYTTLQIATSVVLSDGFEGLLFLLQGQYLVACLPILYILLLFFFVLRLSNALLSSFLCLPLNTALSRATRCMGGSSSGRRRKSHKGRRHSGGNVQTRRQRPRSENSAKQPLLPTTRVLNFEEHAITSGIGYQILGKYGWVKGEPLGERARSGESDSACAGHVRSQPIPIVVRSGRAGLGANCLLLDGHHDRDNDTGDSSATPSSYPMTATKHRHYERSSDIVSRLATMAIYDPLRPRCRYDQSHVVPSLKALHKHEQSCPSNPNRKNSSRGKRLAVPGAPSNLSAADAAGQAWGVDAMAAEDSASGSMSDEEPMLSSISSTSSSSSPPPSP